MTGPHQGQPVIAAGEPLESATAALVMVHGRGATPADILRLVPEISQPGFAYLAPQAAGGTWYPYSFLAPIESNEPGISSGLQALADLFDGISKAGIPSTRTYLLGFSQGACLTLEFTARNPRNYGGIAGLSGGLIGPDGTPATTPVLSKARRPSWAAATWIPTSRRSACWRRPKCWKEWGRL